MQKVPIYFLPGFVPTAELVAWRVPMGATVVVEAKGPKTSGPRRGPEDALCRSPNPAVYKLAALRQCAPSSRSRLHNLASPQVPSLFYGG